MSDDRLAQLFQQQRVLQAKMGYDFPWMGKLQQIEYLKEHVLAATDELHEALAEIGWKSWSTDTHVNSDRMAGELVDTLHFLINMFLCLGYDADMVFDAFQKKHQVNHARQDAGYAVAKTKCAYSGCRRALDEPGSETPLTRDDHDLAWCNEGCYDAWQQARAGEVLEAGGAA